MCQCVYILYTHWHTLTDIQTYWHRLTNTETHADTDIHIQWHTRPIAHINIQKHYDTDTNTMAQTLTHTLTQYDPYTK